MKTHVYTAGKEIPEQIVMSGAHQHEVGIFETLRTYHGKVFKEREHLDRLFESAKTTGFELKHSRLQLQRELQTALKTHLAAYPASNDLTIRMTFFDSRLFLLIGETAHAESLYQQGVKLRTSPVKRSLSNAWFPETKTSAYQNAVLASLEPRADDVYEWLFLDRAGFVTEVRIGNLFMVEKIAQASRKDSHLRTPPAPGILNGVTRRFVIQCAFQCGMQVKETPFTRHDLYNAAEVFLTNTSWEILPVSFLDGRKIGNALPGPVTKKLHQHFKKKVIEEFQ